MALIAFWFLAFFYTAVGTHHILQSPVPEWLKTIAVITSMGMLIPVFAFTINIFMTMRGSWKDAHYSLPLRFALTGSGFYLLTSFQGSTQALRSVNVYVHFTNWSVAHAHLALLGFVAFTLFGTVYYIFPRIRGCGVYSERLGWIHWWLTFGGFITFFLVLTAAGLVQGGDYAQGIPTVAVLPAVRNLWIGRAAAGTVIIVAQYVFAYNMVQTLRGKQARAEVAAETRSIMAEPAMTEA